MDSRRLEIETNKNPSLWSLHFSSGGCVYNKISKNSILDGEKYYGEKMNQERHEKQLCMVIVELGLRDHFK